MEPRFIEGDIVIVKKQPDIESGDIAVVLVNGEEATLKKVIKQQNGIMLVASNQDVYQPTFYSNEAIENLPVEIIGKVVELRGKY
jgi:repressor LexA